MRSFPFSLPLLLHLGCVCVASGFGDPNYGGYYGVEEQQGNGDGARGIFEVAFGPQESSSPFIAPFPSLLLRGLDPRAISAAAAGVSPELALWLLRRVPFQDWADRLFRDRATCAELLDPPLVSVADFDAQSVAREDPEFQKALEEVADSPWAIVSARRLAEGPLSSWESIRELGNILAPRRLRPGLDGFDELRKRLADPGVRAQLCVPAAALLEDLGAVFTSEPEAAREIVREGLQIVATAPARLLESLLGQRTFVELERLAQSGSGGGLDLLEPAPEVSAAVTQAAAAITIASGTATTTAEGTTTATNSESSALASGPLGGGMGDARDMFETLGQFVGIHFVGFA